MATPSPAAASPPGLQGVATAAAAAAVNQLTPASTAVTSAATVAKEDEGEGNAHRLQTRQEAERRGRGECGQGVHGCHFGYGKSGLGSLLASNAQGGGKREMPSVGVCSS